jgi:hypothetical protein
MGRCESELEQRNGHSHIHPGLLDYLRNRNGINIRGATAICHGRWHHGRYFNDSGFAALCKELRNSGKLVFVLPGWDWTNGSETCNLG